MVAFQAIFDYVDCLCEQPNRDPIANGRQINQALLQAITPGTAHPDYYSLYGSRNDGGYLKRMVDRCREELVRLPSYLMVRSALDRSARRIVTYQSLNHGDATGSHVALARWTQGQANRHAREHGQHLNWWEIAASCGSSLGSFALMAVATRPSIDQQDIKAIEHAYFPWIGATNSLLDSLIDQDEDAAPGQNRLLDNYPSPQQAAERLALIIREASYYAGQLPPTTGHTLMFAALLGFYLTDRATYEPGINSVCDHIRTAATEFALPVRLVMRFRRAAACLGAHWQGLRPT